MRRVDRQSHDGPFISLGPWHDEFDRLSHGGGEGMARAAERVLPYEPPDTLRIMAWTAGSLTIGGPIVMQSTTAVDLGYRRLGTDWQFSVFDSESAVLV